MITDPLDDAIETARRACDEIRALLHEKEIELKALELAASLRPSGTRRSTTRPTRDGQNSVAGKGRQVGAISKKWRAIVQRMVLMHPGGALPAEIASLGRSVGLPNLRPRDARERAEKYVTLGYFERLGERYGVTDVAKRRFGIGVRSVTAPAAAPEQSVYEKEAGDAGLE
jgi:hypothetical protein